MIITNDGKGEYVTVDNREESVNCDSVKKNHIEVSFTEITQKRGSAKKR